MVAGLGPRRRYHHAAPSAPVLRAPVSGIPQDRRVTQGNEKVGRATMVRQLDENGSRDAGQDRLERRDMLLLRLEVGRRRRAVRTVSVRRGQREMRSTR
jgi:hypothetical protein